jgi:sugar lactone lactonase YvrE
MIKIVRSILLVVLIASFFFTCRKKNKDDDCPACPSVESISPVNAHAYDKLTISGKNFSVTPALNLVKINGVLVKADSILSGTTTQLVVKVPKGCGSGPVTVDLDDELTNFGTPPVLNYIYRYMVTDYGLKTASPPACIGGASLNTMSYYVRPTGIVVDATGNVFFSDYNSHAIFKLSANSMDSCVFAGLPDTSSTGGSTTKDGLGTIARFRNPGHMYIDNNNTIFVSENSTSIRTISPSGNVATYATSPFLNLTTGIAFHPGNSNLAYASVGGNEQIAKIERKGTLITTTVFAGTGDKGYVDGIGSVAKFNDVEDVVVDNAGNVFIAETNNVIRKITPAGMVSTFAGSGIPKFADGPGTQASFNRPMGICIDPDNTIYVADSKNNCIRKITPEGMVSTIYTFTGGMNTPSPTGIARDKAGNFYIAYITEIAPYKYRGGIKKLTIF